MRLRLPWQRIIGRAGCSNHIHGPSLGIIPAGAGRAHPLSRPFFSLHEHCHNHRSCHLAQHKRLTILTAVWYFQRRLRLSERRPVEAKSIHAVPFLADLNRESIRR
jgi:hypothetical protein